MANPRSIISRPVARVSVSRIVRSRRGGAQEAHKNGEVLHMQHPDDVVLELLRKCPRTVDHFRDGPLHVSDVLGKCTRKIALSEKLRKPMPASNTSDSMGLTYAQGIAMHDYVKQRFVEGHPELIYGKWRCLCGNTVTEPMTYTQRPQRLCPDCGTAPTRYVENDILDEEYGMVGSPDIVLYFEEDGVYYPVEIKSMAYDEWKELARPKPDHVLQVLFYWLFLKRAGFNVPSQVSILYVSKGYLFKSPYKEFVVPVESYEAAQERLAPYIEDALALKAFRDGGELPPRVTCSSMSAKDAKECHVCVACFAG